VLEVDGRSHIVAVTDLSPEGAFLSARLEVAPGAALRLRLIMPNDSREIAPECELVWRNERFDPDTGRPAGLAVRFRGVQGQVREALDACAKHLFSSDHAGRIEYRILERPAIDPTELALLGQGGWELTAALRSEAGVQLILLRRL
jgi:hypothetical protein